MGDLLLRQNVVLTLFFIIVSSNGVEFGVKKGKSIDKVGNFRNLLHVNT